MAGRWSAIDLPEHDVERADDRHDVGQHMPAAKKILPCKWASGDPGRNFVTGFNLNASPQLAKSPRRPRAQFRAAPFATGCRWRRLSAGDTIHVSLPLTGEALCVEA